MYLVTAAEMRAFDASAIEDYGIPGVVLMENAGRTTFFHLRNHLGGDVRDMKVSVVAGPGNNGGDGFVIARYLINYGADVHTFLLSPRDKIKGDALINLRVLEKMTPDIFAVSDEEALDEATDEWHQSDVIVDAILGTGLSSEVRSPYREAIREINGSPAFILAVDLPSGLDADTGDVLGCAVKADLTVTYGFRKLGTALYPGLIYCGAIEVADISIPFPAVEKNPPKALFYTRPDAEHYQFLRLNAEAHKGTFGHLLIVGGSPGKTGAPAMAARAAARIGAGLVTVGIPASLNPVLETKLTEEMTEPLPETVTGFLGEASIDRILSLSQEKRCMILGPGMSTEQGISELVRTILSSYEGWLILDADGLNALDGDPGILKTAKAQVVVTPHPGEMARLVGMSSAEVQADRVGTARTFAGRHGVWVVLKGAGTITASPDGTVTINGTGNSWMASGGQGDALSGILGGLLVQNISPEEALPFGVYIHGLCADNLVERYGPAPVLATDVIEELPRALGGKNKGE
ncbi:MAG TPA: NAD(P)H-hydrate dehydratase [Desulfomonilaceae bacterium]|nr:NAD(P)H-hydrate dehydratase [Desulfomonilaceae bacterium]